MITVTTAHSHAILLIAKDVGEIPKMEVHIKAPKGKQRKIVNKTFAEMVAGETDPFWTSVFDKASRGVFRKGLTFNGGILTHRHKGKRNTIIIDRGDMNEEVKDFMVKYARISESGSVIEGDVINVDVITDWTGISKEKYHETAIRRYIDRYIEESGRTLSNDHRLQFYNTIRCGLALKNITADMVIERGVIIRIPSIKWDDEKNIFYIVNSEYTASKVANKKPTSVMQKRWTKFMTTQ